MTTLRHALRTGTPHTCSQAPAMPCGRRLNRLAASLVLGLAAVCSPAAADTDVHGSVWLRITLTDLDLSDGITPAFSLTANGVGVYSDGSLYSYLVRTNTSVWGEDDVTGSVLLDRDISSTALLPANLSVYSGAGALGLSGDGHGGASSWGSVSAGYLRASAEAVTLESTSLVATANFQLDSLYTLTPNTSVAVTVYDMDSYLSREGLSSLSFWMQLSDDTTASVSGASVELDNRLGAVAYSDDSLATPLSIHMDNTTDLVQTGSFGVGLFAWTSAAATTSTVPEPASAVMMLSGLAGLAGMGGLRRRRSEHRQPE